ncbi:unannotated protein [freshwater metagenome]|uniref:Unannotated protein n=1 Tax=freshwater metagenome TaxID=449393 RepID=A0A6J6LZK4_9ZZZZ
MMNGSRIFFAIPANARRTGKPSPSKPLGAVVTERTGRSVTSAPGELMRASVSVSAVTAGMRESFIDGQLISCVHNHIGQRSSIRKICRPGL